MNWLLVGCANAIAAVDEKQHNYNLSELFTEKNNEKNREIVIIVAGNCNIPIITSKNISRIFRPFLILLIQIIGSITNRMNE